MSFSDDIAEWVLATTGVRRVDRGVRRGVERVREINRREWFAAERARREAEARERARLLHEESKRFAADVDAALARIGYTGPKPTAMCTWRDPETNELQVVVVRTEAE